MTLREAFVDEAAALDAARLRWGIRRYSSRADLQQPFIGRWRDALHATPLPARHRRPQLQEHRAVRPCSAPAEPPMTMMSRRMSEDLQAGVRDFVSYRAKRPQSSRYDAC